MPILILEKGKKYRAVKTEVNGIKFSSKLEARVYSELKKLEDAGKIKIKSLQPKVYLSKAKILYKPDFECLNLETNEVYYVEAKGMELDTWRIKRRLYLAYGSNDLQIWKSVGQSVKCVETLKAGNGDV